MSDPYLNISPYHEGKGRYLNAASSIPRQYWSGCCDRREGEGVHFLQAKRSRKAGETFFSFLLSLPLLAALQLVHFATWDRDEQMTKRKRERERRRNSGFVGRREKERNFCPRRVSTRIFPAQTAFLFPYKIQREKERKLSKWLAITINHFFGAEASSRCNYKIRRGASRHLILMRY